MKIEISPDIYSYEALKIAKNIVDKDNSITIQNHNDKIIVMANDENTQMINLFLNEALAQQCRIDTLNKNMKISNIITTLAIVSALGTKGGKK